MSTTHARRTGPWSLVTRGGGRGLRWWREAGVQIRSTLLAATVQGVVVLAAGAVLLLALSHDLQTSIDSTNLATAQSLEALVSDQLSATTDLQEAIDAAARRRAAIQVLDADGNVLAVAGPLLLLTVGAATYLFIGRSLRPVSEIRATVERISHRDLSERVPIPPGHDEVARLARTMNTMLGGLDRASTTQRQFVSDASHELRSPIATLRAAADIALTVPERAEAGDLARSVQGESQRLDHLVTDLLLLARIDERGRACAATGAPVGEVDLDDLVTEAARRLRTSTTLEIAVHREPARVSGDALELSRVLRNPADNAARHAASKVSVELRRNGSNAVLAVTNDCPPIAPTDRERVFDRFVRLEESRARDLGGSGLGLAIVKDLVTAHGGTVRVLDPTDGSRGTCFVVEFPLRDW